MMGRSVKLEPGDPDRNRLGIIDNPHLDPAAPAGRTSRGTGRQIPTQ